MPTQRLCTTPAPDASAAASANNKYKALEAAKMPFSVLPYMLTIRQAKPARAQSACQAGKPDNRAAMTGPPTEAA
jgi:hypothetical protein